MTPINEIQQKQCTSQTMLESRKSLSPTFDFAQVTLDVLTLNKFIKQKCEMF